VAEKTGRDEADLAAELVAFMRVRFKGVLGERLPGDVADAVIGEGDLDLVDADARARALEAFRGGTDWAPFAVAFRRVANITRDQGAAAAARPVDATRFEAPAERALHEAFGAARESVEPLLRTGRYADALRELSRLRPIVDRFFDEVFVMVDDDAVRHNRLALLTDISRLFGRIADFSRIAADA
jgi:glycyl-tRNA synthetase beta chain